MPCPDQNNSKNNKIFTTESSKVTVVPQEARGSSEDTVLNMEMSDFNVSADHPPAYHGTPQNPPPYGPAPPGPYPPQYTQQYVYVTRQYPAQYASVDPHHYPSHYETHYPQSYGGSYPQQQMYGQPVQEQNDMMMFTYTDKFETPEARRLFIRKVYSILSAQLAFCFLVTSICSFVPEIRFWVMAHFYLLFIFMGIYFLLAMIMCFCPEVLFKSPENSIYLLSLTLALTGMVAWTGTAYAKEAVAIALGATLIVVIILTLLAFQSKVDFTGCTGLLLVLLVLLLILGIVAAFLYEYIPYVQLIYAGLGAVLMCFFIVVDTQRLMSDKRVTLDTDMHVLGAISLFIDIVLLFLYILRIVGDFTGKT